jgi:hypothetical protein
MGIDRPLTESTCFYSAQSFGAAIGSVFVYPNRLSFDQNRLSPKTGRVLLRESEHLQIERNILGAHQKTVFDKLAINFI